jgi:SAM-dependent methyltransferase
MNNNLCFICNGNLKQGVISNGFNYYKCNKCFTSQILPQPSQDALEDYYSRYHQTDEQGGRYDWIERRMQNDFPAKIKLLKKLRKGTKATLLDVGCGKGFFVLKCNESGFDAKGIDLSASGIEYAETILDVNALRGKIEEYSNLDGYKESFDFITLLATIEHLPDPFTTLSSIYNCLKPGGVFLLDTGLGNDKFEKFLSGHSQWFDAPQHLFVFSQKGLEILLEKCGFKIFSLNKNFDRNIFRQYVRWLRHTTICISSYIFFRILLGKTGYKSM